MSRKENLCYRPCHGTVTVFISLHFFGWTPSHERPRARCLTVPGRVASNQGAHERSRPLRRRRGRYLSLTRSGGGGGGARGEGQRGEKGALTTPLRVWYHIGVGADGKQNKSDLSSCRYKGHHKSALKQMCCFCRMARIIAPCLSRHAAEGQGPHGGEEKGGARGTRERR